MVWWHRRREHGGRYSAPPPRRGPSSDAEKPEIKTMTQGGTYRAGGLDFDETVGLAGAAGVLEAMAAGDVADRSLHATGMRCARCRLVFLAETPVRRTETGDWVHDVCPSSD